MEEMEQEIEFNKYSRGKIYKIICNLTGDVYFGSTIQTLEERLKKHISDYNRYLNGTLKCYCTSLKILANNNFEIILIELYPCASKEELTAREGHFIKTNICVNKVIPGRTPKEYKTVYQTLKKDKIKVHKKEYYEKNKHQISEKSKNYYDNNKDTIQNRVKQYYDNNKQLISERRKEILICYCGCSYRKTDKARHLKTLKHKNFVANQNIETTTI